MIVSMLRNSSHVNSPVFRQTQWQKLLSKPGPIFSPQKMGGIYGSSHVHPQKKSGSISMFLDQIYEIPWKNPMSDGETLLKIPLKHRMNIHSNR